MTARWYVLHVYSGFEGKVAEAIREKAGKSGLAERIEDIMVPTEEVTKSVAARKLTPNVRYSRATSLPKSICRMKSGTW